MRVLFICNQGENRSKTAEELFKDRSETRSAGLYNPTPVTEKDLDWADLVVVMEARQRRELAERFPATYLEKRIVCLDVLDIYRYNSPELIKELKLKVMPLIRENPQAFPEKST